MSNPNRKLDVRTIPKALKITEKYHRANRLVEAEQGYSQILEVQPEHQDALYGLAVIMQRKGEYQTAENLLKSRQTGDLKIAIAYYRQAIAMNPDLVDARDNLILTLQEQDNIKIKVSCAKR